MSIARFYMKTQKWIPALNRLKTVTEKYDKTVFIEEALHRLVEVYYRLGLTDPYTNTFSLVTIAIYKLFLIILLDLSISTTYYL